MILIDLEKILVYRRWEQVNNINFGKLLSYIGEVRELQKELGCGKVFPASYLGTYAKDKDKNYVLVIDLMKSLDSVYDNRPVVHAKIVVGKQQVVVKVKDLHKELESSMDVVYNTEDRTLDTVEGLLELFKTFGLKPVKTADLYFGTYKPEYQTSFDDSFSMLSDKKLNKLEEILSPYGFEKNSSSCYKKFGDFSINISSKNIYNDYIVSLVDNNDRANIHWSIKEENLESFVKGMDKRYNKWKKLKY